MTIKSWPDIGTGTGTGEVAKNVKIFWARWDKYLGTTVLTKTVAPKNLFNNIFNNFLNQFFWIFRFLFLNFFFIIRCVSSQQRLLRREAGSPTPKQLWFLFHCPLFLRAFPINSSHHRDVFRCMEELTHCKKPMLRQWPQNINRINNEKYDVLASKNPFELAKEHQQYSTLPIIHANT